MYNKIMKWYALGLWTADMVQTAANKGVITAEQAAHILEE